jgi:uncharacterized protein (DUF302 family)
MPHFAVALSVDEAAGVLRQALAQVPLNVVAHIDGQANAARIGAAVPADQILEVFRPDLAVKVWQAHKPAGIDIPLRIHLYEEDGRTWVRFRTPSEVFSRHRSPALDALAVQIDPLFGDALASLYTHQEHR